MQLLQRQYGIINFAPLKPFFVALASSSHAVAAPFPSCPSLLSPLLRGGGWPRNCLGMPALVERLKAGYNMVTAGKFAEALEAFTFILAAISLTSVDSRQQLAEVKELMRICREYITAMKLELHRGEVRKANGTAKRIIELAAYFTHCQLQPTHTLLALRSAMKLAYKAKLFNTASSFARRLLELNPKPELATEARKVVQLCDANPTDAFTLDYDERNPFVLCNISFVPIYRGSALLSCSYCKAPFLPEHKGKVSTTCGMGEVGGESIGIPDIDADGKPL